MLEKASFLCWQKKRNVAMIKVIQNAQVVKLVDTPDLGSGAVRCVGSSPILGIHSSPKNQYFLSKHKTF